MIPIKLLPLFGSMLLLTVSCNNQNSLLNSTPTQPTTEPTVVREIDPIQHTRKRTLEAWQAIQKADGESRDTLSNYPNFKKLSTIDPFTQSLNRVATAYSQIDLTDVDPLLVNHIAESMNAYVAYSTALKSCYSDLSILAEDLNGNVELARRVGGWTGLPPGGDIAEFLTRLATDDEVKNKTELVLAKHKPNIIGTLERLYAIGKTDIDLAEQLTEKYGTPFLDPF